jgi:transposase
MAYSMDLRLKVLAALDEGASQASVARRFDVGLRTVKRFKARRDAGRIEAEKTGPKSPIKLTPEDDQLMREMIAKRPGITANQLRVMLSVQVAECTVCRRLKKLGLTLKKSR